jgi:hypothetical protein
MIKIHITDGGRAAAGFQGKGRDCVCRAITIATRLPYREIYARLSEGNAKQRITARSPVRSAGRQTANDGIIVQRKWFREYMDELGFVWTPTMFIGQGCTVHLRENELPKGRLVVAVSRHCCAVIDSVLHDNHDCTRGGTRCVYGYWRLKRNRPTRKC